MAEREVLTGPEVRRRTRAAGFLPASAADALFSAPFPSEDRTRERAVIYWTVLIGLLIVAVLLRRSTWTADPSLHSMLEAAAAAIAMGVGGLALVRYYGRPESIFLFVGTGFLGSGLLTALHAARSTGIGDLDSNAAEWSWLVGQLYLAGFLLLAWLHSRPEVEERPSQSAWVVYGAGLTVAAAAGTTALLLPMSPAALGQVGVGHPLEFIPGFVFGLALLGFLRRESWRRERLQHWLVLALWMLVVMHTAFLAFSTSPGDALFIGAHILKVGAFVAVLVGLHLSLYARLRLGGEAFRAEQILQESRRQLQDFLDNANDLLQSTAPNGRIVYANRAWKRTLGYTDHELQELDLFSIVHHSSLRSFRSQFRRVLAGEALTNVEVQFVAADGRLVLCSGNMNCRFENGEPVATRSIFRDVTEQRRAELELEASQANLTALVENTGDAIWSVDPDLRLITFNSAFALAVEASTGREPHVGAPLEAAVRIEEVDWYRELYQRALAGARFSQVRVDQYDGQHRHFELFFNPIIGDRGPRGVVVFGKDVTPRKRAEEALRMAKEEAETANRTKSQFLASMSHELRTPLNSVIGFANILRKNRSGLLAEQDLEFLNRILANGKHLLTLINDVLDLAKVEAGRLDLELSPVDLPALVRETVQQMEGQARGKTVVLRADVPESVRQVRADPRRLKQVLINLVGNALKFTHDGEVAVRLVADEVTGLPLTLSVEDTGIGIPPERLEAIFEAFQQADAGTNRKYGGTGLGLTISRSICQLMGYAMTVESEMGQGARFIIQFPVWERPESAATPDLLSMRSRDVEGVESLVSESMETRTVLVVDDEPDARLLISHYLEDFGCQVLTAGSGEEALEIARAHHPDLITTDLMMPGMTGWQLLKAVKSDPLLADIPVVVVSIVASGESRLLGAVDLLTKPVEREAFLRVLWRNLPRSGRQVLLVDDDPVTCRLVQGYLKSTELEVETVSNGREALAVLGHFKPDLVLLDLVMPVMDGMSLLDHLRADAAHVNTPVVVMTGKALTEVEVRELQGKTSGVISKKDDLGVKLREVVSAALSERAHASR